MTELEDKHLKEKINSWFLEEENVSSIRSFLKSLVLQKIIEEDDKSDQKFLKRNFDSVDISIAFLVADFFLQNHFHYSLSVFSSEILSTTLKEYFSDYFNKISYKWDPRKPPTLDYGTACEILSSIAVSPSSKIGRDAIHRYYLGNEGPLFRIIIFMMRSDQARQEDLHSRHKRNSGSPQNDSLDSTNSVMKHSKEELKQKEMILRENIILHKREFAKCHNMISSCNEALNMKMARAQNFLEELKLAKEEIHEEVILAKSQSKFIENIDANLSIISGYFEKVCELNKTKGESSIAIGSEKLNSVNMESQTFYECANKSCQTEASLVEQGSQTLDLIEKKNSSTQTDILVDHEYLKRLEKEKFELYSFIEQQQERINTLNKKTVKLNSLIQSSSKNNSDIHNNPEVILKHQEFGEKSVPCHCLNLETLLDYYNFCTNSMKNKFEFLKNHRHETETKYISYLEKEKFNK